MNIPDELEKPKESRNMTQRAGDLEAGMLLVKEFLTLNGLPPVKLKIITEGAWPFHECAYWRADTINICLRRCAQRGRGGRAWSWPGYVVDRTPYGVVCHETGHHVDFHLSKNTGAYFGDFSSKLRKLTGDEAITSYFPDDAEWFAEIMRLFITNPDLLRSIRPKIFARVNTYLKPVEKRTWKRVLKDAPERTKLAAQRKIDTAQKKSERLL